MELLVQNSKSSHDKTLERNVMCLSRQANS